MRRESEYDKKIERVRKLARKIFKKEKLNIPVDIQSLVRKYANLICEDIPFADAICYGIESKPTIIYNPDTIETRFRFTLAHELGHIKIPWHVGMVSCHTDEEEIDEYEYNQIETQANVFASELLIPSDWLKEEIRNKKLNRLNEIIEHVSHTANVSLQASLYAVLNSLPENYFVKIEYVDKDYIQYKKSENIELSELKCKGEYDGRVKYLPEWLEYNAGDFGQMKIFNEKVSWVRLGDKVKQEYIQKLLNSYTKEIDLNNVFYTIFEENKYSPAINLKSVCYSLPKGFIIYLQSNDGRYYNKYVSKDTFIQPYSENNLVEEMILWCQENSVNNGIYIMNGFSVNWYEFDVDNKYEVNKKDTRDSKAILRSILDNHYLQGKQRQKVTAAINGIIGFQSDRNSNGKEELYSKLKQKYLGREDLKEITSDIEFDLFLAKKIQELEQKKVNK